MEILGKKEGKLQAGRESIVKAASSGEVEASEEVQVGGENEIDLVAHHLIKQKPARVEGRSPER